MSSVAPGSSASNAGSAVEMPVFPFRGRIEPGELTDLQASLLLKYYDACIAVAGFSSGSSTGASTNSAGSVASESNSRVSGKPNWNKRQRKRNRRVKAGVEVEALVQQMSGDTSGYCYDKLLVGCGELGSWPTVERLLLLPESSVLPNEELAKLKVQRVAATAYHVGAATGPSLLHALVVTVKANPALLLKEGSLAERLQGVEAPRALMAYPLGLAHVVGGQLGFPIVDSTSDGFGGSAVTVPATDDLSSRVASLGFSLGDVPNIVAAYRATIEIVDCAEDFNRVLTWQLGRQPQAGSRDVVVSNGLFKFLCERWGSMRQHLSGGVPNLEDECPVRDLRSLACGRHVALPLVEMFSVTSGVRKGYESRIYVSDEVDSVSHNVWCDVHIPLGLIRRTVVLLVADRVEFKVAGQVLKGPCRVVLESGSHVEMRFEQESARLTMVAYVNLNATAVSMLQAVDIPGFSYLGAVNVEYRRWVAEQLGPYPGVDKVANLPSVVAVRDVRMMTLQVDDYGRVWDSSAGVRGISFAAILAGLSSCEKGSYAEKARLVTGHPVSGYCEYPVMQ